MLEVRLQIFHIAIVLRGHELRLDEIAPRLRLEEALPAIAQPVVRVALLELGDAVVLRAEGDEAGDGRVVAALDVGAQELAALREAQAIDGGSAGEDGVQGEVGADLSDLFVDVAPKGGSLVRIGVVIEVNKVDVGARVDRLRKVTYGAQAIGFIAMY